MPNSFVFLDATGATWPIAEQRIPDVECRRVRQGRAAAGIGAARRPSLATLPANEPSPAAQRAR